VLELRDVRQRRTRRDDAAADAEHRCALHLHHERAPRCRPQIQLGARTAGFDEALGQVLPNALSSRLREQCGQVVGAEVRAVDAQHPSRGEIDLPQSSVAVQAAVSDGCEIEQIRVPAARLLQQLLRLAQLSVLHLEFDLMHLELVQQALGLGHGLGCARLGAQRPQLVHQRRA
jgi:hypothetical protein